MDGGVGRRARVRGIHVTERLSAAPGSGAAAGRGPKRRPVRNPVGRPPASDSVETRKRILTAARACFGAWGYEKTTNRAIAEAAGITTGAIYHYFPSKVEVFGACLQESLDAIFGAFRQAADGQVRLVEKIDAILESAVQLHAKDPSLATLASTAAVDVRRLGELEPLMPNLAASQAFFTALVADSADELAPDVEPAGVVNCLVAVTLGLAQYAAVIGSVEAHRAGTLAFSRLVDGTLFANPGVPAVPRAGGSPAR